MYEFVNNEILNFFISVSQHFPLKTTLELKASVLENISQGGTQKQNENINFRFLFKKKSHSGFEKTPPPPGGVLKIRFPVFAFASSSLSCELPTSNNKDSKSNRV